MTHPERLTAHDLGIKPSSRALETTLADLGRTLAGLGATTGRDRMLAAAAELEPLPHRSHFPEDVFARIDAATKRAAQAFDAPFIAAMLNERHRIAIAVYGPRQMNMWPVPGKSIDSVLADAKAAHENVQWWQDGRRADIRQAITAIEIIIAEEAAG